MAWGKKKPSAGETPEGDRPRRRDTRSLFGLTVLARVQALVTAADGAITLPKAEEGSKRGSSYAKSLLNATPQKPQLRVLAIKRGDGQTTITVGIGTRNGATQSDFTIRGVLTTDNADATGQSIATLLKDRSAAAMCARELKALVAQPEGSQKTFALGAHGRLAIESGMGE